MPIKRASNNTTTSRNGNNDRLGRGGGEAAHLPLQLRMPLTRRRGNATREPTRASPTQPRAASKYPKLFQSQDQEEQ